MKRNQTMTALVLISAVLLGGLTMAADLPAQESRIWAPTGDLIGQPNHATLGMTSWDPHGNKPKYAEDWQQEDDLLFSGLLGYDRLYDNGRSLVVRGFGESGRGTFAGRLTLVTKSVDGFKLNFDFRNFNNFYDITSEMRASRFGNPPAPPALDGVPSLAWLKGKISLGYDLGKGFDLDLTFNRLRKDGTKGSLLRGSTGNSVPNIKNFDTKTNEVILGVGYRGTSLDVAGRGSFRATDGDRAVGDHVYTDDQTFYRAGLDLTYRFNSTTSLLGAASVGKLETTNGEVWEASSYSPTGEAKTSNGRLAFITRIGPTTTARLTAGLGKWDTDGQTDLAGAIEQATTRQRNSLDLGVLLTNNSLSKTRLRFDYRFKNSNLEETTAEGNLPGDGNGNYQSKDQDRQSHRANLRVGVRLGRKSTLKAVFGWHNQTVDQTNTASAEPLYYTMGDRKQNRLSARLALSTRPSSKVRLDLGIQGHDQSFEREDVAGVKTKSTASRTFVGLNYSANDRLTFLGTGSYGIEKYETEGGPVAGTSMGPLTYEGKTLRFAPGVILVLSHRLEIEAHYEGIRFEDPGDLPNDGNQLRSDLDRILLRAGYRVAGNMKVTATYRRHEFDENRWDDYIMDLYSLSFSGRF